MVVDGVITTDSGDRVIVDDVTTVGRGDRVIVVDESGGIVPFNPSTIFCLIINLINDTID